MNKLWKKHVFPLVARLASRVKRVIISGFAVVTQPFLLFHTNFFFFVCTQLLEALFLARGTSDTKSLLPASWVSRSKVRIDWMKGEKWKGGSRRWWGWGVRDIGVGGGRGLKVEGKNWREKGEGPQSHCWKNSLCQSIDLQSLNHTCKDTVGVNP